MPRPRSPGRRLISLLKKRGRCARCGIRDYRTLAFHHKHPSEKLYDVPVIARSRGLLALATEIAKCIFLCANCHAISHSEDI